LYTIRLHYEDDPANSDPIVMIILSEMHSVKYQITCVYKGQ